MKKVAILLASALCCGAVTSMATSLPTSHLNSSILGSWRGDAKIDAYSIPDQSCSFTYHIIFRANKTAHVIRSVNSGKSIHCTNEDFVTSYVSKNHAVTLDVVAPMSQCDKRCVLTLHQKETSTQGDVLTASGYLDVHPSHSKTERLHYFGILFKSPS